MLNKFLIILIGLIGLNANAATLSKSPDIISVKYDRAYLPDGFDSNDHVQIVGEGTFLNLCYKPESVEVVVNHQERTINVNPKAYFYHSICAQVTVDFHNIIAVGLLDVGRYRVIGPDHKTVLGEINIKAATSSSPDDYLYAPISQAYFQQTGSNNSITLGGTFTNSCMRLVDVLVNVQPNVVTVQPIAEMQERSDCTNGSFPFERTVRVNALNHGRYLLHVRSLNGTAINNLVDVE